MLHIARISRLMPGLSLHLGLIQGPTVLGMAQSQLHSKIPHLAALRLLLVRRVHLLHQVVRILLLVAVHPLRVAQSLVVHRLAHQFLVHHPRALLRVLLVYHPVLQVHQQPL